MADVSRWPSVSWTSRTPRGAHHSWLSLCPRAAFKSLKARFTKGTFRSRGASTSFYSLRSKGSSQTRSSLWPLSAYFSRSSRETLLARLSWRSNSPRWSSFSPGSCSPWPTLGSWFAFRSLRTGHLARLTLSRFGPWRQFVTSFSFHRVWIAGHDHPLQVNCLGRLAVHQLADQDLPIQVDPAVDQLQWLLSDRLAVDIEQNFVTEDPKMELVPLSVKDLRNIPGQGL